jgi:TolB-like protein
VVVKEKKMKQTMIHLFKAITCIAAFVGASASTAQPVVNIDSSIVNQRINHLIPNAYRYEPIVSITSRAPSGIFNSGVIFLGEQIDRSIASDTRSRQTIITSFADLNNLGDTTHFGRLVGENLMHELQIKGWSVTDVRLTRDLIINTAGEFSLSRDIKRLRETMPAANVVTGTYSSTSDGVLLNVRVLDLSTGQVVGSAQTRFIKDAFVSSLIDPPKVIPTVKLTN